MKRKIDKVTTVREEHASLHGRTYRWWSVAIHTVHLECGHTKIYRGDNCPTASANCKQCDLDAKGLVAEHFSIKASAARGAIQ